MNGPGHEVAALVIEFDGWSRQEAMDGVELVVGRSQECDLVLPDTRLSRRHCRIFRHDGEWRVEDLGSATGTFVDDIRVQGPVPLHPGAVLRMGSTSARLELRSPSSVLSGDRGQDDRNLALLLQTIGELYASTNVDALLRTIVDRAVRLADGGRGALLLAGADGLEAVAARSADGRDLPPEQVLSRSLPMQALASGRAVVLRDSAATPGSVSPSVLLSDLRSVLCVPLPGAAGPAGVLYVDARTPATVFGPTELSILEALAVQASLALDRTRAGEERQRREREARRRLESENAALKAKLEIVAPIGDSPPMQRALDILRRVAPSDATVLLTGETGTGKEVLARYLHRLSARAGAPFVVVDCGAIPEGLIESELFGHEKGAFTGAGTPRDGRFREAAGGTIFLDEIGELPLGLQTRLLRVIQERTVQPVGGKRPISVDVRIICATHRDLAKSVSEGRFRQDLYYRISVLAIDVPPLRERGRDVLVLARYFLKRFTTLHGTAVTGFTREAEAALLSLPWPGNVRELENRVQRAALLATPPYATLRDLGVAGETRIGAVPETPGEQLPCLPLQEARAKANFRFERTYLEDVLRRSSGSVGGAASLARVSRQMLQRLLSRHGIDRLTYRGQ